MNINKKHFVCMVLSFCLLTGTTANAAITGITLTSGVADMEFTLDRTLYYVSSDYNSSVPEISVQGGHIVQSATDFGDNNLTVIQDDETKKQYRFVFQSPKKEFTLNDPILSAKGVLTIKGTCDSDVTMTILKTKVQGGDSAYELNEIDYNNPKQVLDVVTIASNDYNSGYSYCFSEKEVSGTYRIIVGTNNNSKISKTVYFATTKDLEICKEMVNKGFGNNDEFLKFMDSYLNTLQIKKEVYDIIKDKQIYKEHLSKVPFADVQGIIDACRYATAVGVLNECGKDDIIKTILLYNDSVFKIDLTSVYSEIHNKKLIESAYFGIKSNSFEIATKNIKGAIATAYINESVPSNIETRFNKVIFDLPLDSQVVSNFKNVLNSNQRETALKSLVNQNFANSDTLCTQFKTMIEDLLKKDDDQPSGGNSTNSGGGSISVSGGNKNPVVTKEPDSEIPKKDEKVPNIEKFDDISDVVWANEAILLLSDWGVVNGKSETKFVPNDFVTREEFVKMLMLAIDYSQSAIELKFTDVASDAWYHDYVSYALKAGITTGISEDKFGVGMNITRQDMAVMLYKASKTAEITLNEGEKVVFNDSALIAPYATEAIEKLTQGKIINGMGNGNFSPTTNLTRAQAVVAIYKLVANK